MPQERQGPEGGRRLRHGHAGGVPAISERDEAHPSWPTRPGPPVLAHPSWPTAAPARSSTKTISAAAAPPAARDGRKAKADGRAGKAPAGQPDAGRHAWPGAAVTVGLGGAGARYAVSDTDAGLFDGVPGLGTQPEAPGGTGTAPAAQSEAGTSELEQAANAQLPLSVRGGDFRTDTAVVLPSWCCARPVFWRGVPLARAA